MTTILLVNKEPSTNITVYHAITAMHDQSYILVEADGVEKAVSLAEQTFPDLFIIDTAQVEVCRRLRALPLSAHKPILFLLNSASAQDIANVLDAGGDDCMRYPINPQELAARMRTLLRRHKGAAPPPHTLVLNLKSQQVQVCGRDIELTPTEFDLLEMLCRTPGKHVRTEDLLEQVWHYPRGMGDPALVRNHVRNLRRKLEADPDRPKIVTSFHGRGYTVSATVARE